ALPWCNVDFDRRVIRVRDTVYEGLLNTENPERSTRPSHGAATAANSLPASHKNEDALPRRTRLCQSGRERVQARQFTATPSPPRGWGTTYRRSKTASATSCAGLPPISWHAFRRTHATLLSDLGEPLETAQAQLGHASFTTTAEIYAHAVPASQRAAVEKLEQAVLTRLDPNGPQLASLRVH